MGTEKYVGTDEFLDINILSDLRSKHEHDKVYEITKKKYGEHPDDDFIMSQYLISILEYNPKLTNDIKEVSDRLQETNIRKNIKYAAMGYTVYYLGMNDPDKAYKNFQKIKDLPFHRRKVVSTISFFKCSKTFRKMIFDVNRAIEEIQYPDIHDDRYMYKTFDIGEYFLERRDYTQALQYFKLSLDKRLTSERLKDKIEKQPLCYARIGKCYFHLYDFENFDFNYKKALETAKKTSIDLYYKLLYEYILDLNDFNRIEEARKLTYELDKGNARDKCLAIFARGKILKNLCQFDEAIAIFKELLTKDSSNHEYDYVELIKSYTIINKPDEAEKYVNKLYKEYPTYNPITKVAFLHDSGRHEEAIEEAKKQLGTEYESDARYFIGRSLNRLRRYEESEEYLVSCIGKVHKSTLYFELGLLYDKIGDYEKAYKYYNEYIERGISRNDKARIQKGLSFMIDLLTNTFDFNSASYFVNLYETYFIEDEPEAVDFMKAQYHFRKQEYEIAKGYYNKLLGTEYDSQARMFLSVIYRYTNENDKIPDILKGLEETPYCEQIQFSIAKELKDKHTKESLKEAYKVLSSFEPDAEFTNMLNVEKIQVLIKLKEYDLAEQELEDAYKKHNINVKEYYRFRGYISLKQGKLDPEDPKYKNIFLTYCQSYNEGVAFNNIVSMGESNKGRKELYYSHDELFDLYEDISHSLNFYDHYVSDLYDVYVIDMGEVIGNFFGNETRYLEVKCEINTYYIHMMQPTLKTINVTKYVGNVRRRTDLGEN